MESNDPLVTVVIPTYDRPQLVLRAVRSALTQTLNAIEVIVVIDGPDEVTLQGLQKIEDPRLKIRMLSHHVGAPDSRNTGVVEARSQWIAFLDDDDEWLPKKLEIQLKTALQFMHPHPIITCHLMAQTESETFIWPRSVLRDKEALSEYLFCLKSLTAPFFGEGLIQTSTIFTTKELSQRVPFTSGLPRNQDADWLLRASFLEGAFIEFVPECEPLVIWHIEDNRTRIATTINDWHLLSLWAQANRHLMTSHAYASYLMISVSGFAAKAQKWRAFPHLLWKAYRYGKPTIVDLFAYLIIWLIPRSIRHQVVQWLNRGSPS